MCVAFWALGLVASSLHTLSRSQSLALATKDRRPYKRTTGSLVRFPKTKQNKKNIMVMRRLRAEAEREQVQTAERESIGMVFYPLVGTGPSVASVLWRVANVWRAFALSCMFLCVAFLWGFCRFLCCAWHVSGCVCCCVWRVIVWRLWVSCGARVSTPSLLEEIAEPPTLLSFFRLSYLATEEYWWATVRPELLSASWYQPNLSEVYAISWCCCRRR